MAAQADAPFPEQPHPESKKLSWWRKVVGKHGSATAVPSVPNPEPPAPDHGAPPPASEVGHRGPRKVVPGLPRAQTFKRQQSENREKLEAVQPTPAERRAVSVDRRGHLVRHVSNQHHQFPRASAPNVFGDHYSTTTDGLTASVSHDSVEEKHFLAMADEAHADLMAHPVPLEGPPTDTDHHHHHHIPRAPPSITDAQSTTTSQYEATIHEELESKWILNLSMHFRDKSKREKFFVTYREKEYTWRRVTISLDYRNAPVDSLERDLLQIRFQREKSGKIYEAIRESLQDIQFYDTVTNLKLQTTEGRLHVHVVEDVNEIIHYPTIRMVQHLRCRRVRERDLDFDSHMSGFVYKVRVDGRTLIKKEIPGPDTVDEFLYEINALSSLQFSHNVIDFYGVVVDDDGNVKGLLIDYAEQGALIDVIYDSQEQQGPELTWATRERWARQIVRGLSDIHEAGFVQGDFTLSNIVIDDENNAKIIDINRRGCPVGWEPPEATPLIESGQRISMYIGVKSDLYQLGMVLWALATQEDEPEAHRRPLRIDADLGVPPWYRRIVENCLSENPRSRLQATQLLSLFPEAYDEYELDPPSMSGEDGYGRPGRPLIRNVTPRLDWGYASPGPSEDSYYYPPRGRSPPSPLPSNLDCESPDIARNVVWSEHGIVPPAVDDVHPDDTKDTTPKNHQSPAARGPTAPLDNGSGDTKMEPEAYQEGTLPNRDGYVVSNPDLTPGGDGAVVPAAPEDDVETDHQCAEVPSDGPTPTGAITEPKELGIELLRDYPELALAQPATAGQKVEAANHLDETAKHLDETANHPDEAAKHPDETTNHPDETFNHPDGIVNNLDETTAQPDETAKHPDGIVNHPDEIVHHPDEIVHRPDETVHHRDETVSHPDETTKHSDGIVNHPDEAIKHPDGTADPDPPGPAVLQQDPEVSAMDNAANQLDDSNETSSNARPTEATSHQLPPPSPPGAGTERQVSPPREVPTELKGIGSIYEHHDGVRQPTCSDEDLGITAATTTASQNVTSPA